jgi:stage II sporulation protein D
MNQFFLRKVTIMKYIIFLTIAIIIGAVIFIPATLTIFLRQPETPQPPSPLQTAENTVETKTLTENTADDILISVYIEPAGQTITLPLEEYLIGVVAAEMPAAFETEALKAQAVAARTYAAKKMRIFGGNGYPGRPDADISSNYAVGQAFAENGELKAKWGKDYEKYLNKIAHAVNSTHGIVITHNGYLITAAYHSTSGERTASSKEVWGTDFPYLQSVNCSWDKLAPRYTDSKEISRTELMAKLGADVGIPAYAKDNSVSLPMNILERTESGRVAKLEIGGKIISGQEAREKLRLRSTNFTIEPNGASFLIKTVGYGHGVGLCQYGANGQAKEGRNFRQILNYYYQNITFMNLFSS